VTDSSAQWLRHVERLSLPGPLHGCALALHLEEALTHPEISPGFWRDLAIMKLPGQNLMEMNITHCRPARNFVTYEQSLQYLDDQIGH
jgi:hypothetical protein